MSGPVEPFDYGIRKDVRNNPIVREVDQRRQRELRLLLGICSVFVLVLLGTAWQQFELLRHGYRLEQLQLERTRESEVSRHLRLEIETLKSPQRIETLALGMGLIEPGLDDAVVIERRIRTDSPASALVAAR